MTVLILLHPLNPFYFWINLKIRVKQFEFLLISLAIKKFFKFVFDFTFVLFDDCEKLVKQVQFGTRTFDFLKFENESFK